MGFPCYTKTISNNSTLRALQDYIFLNLLKVITFHQNYFLTRNGDDDPNAYPTSAEFHPSPSLVLLPPHLMSKPIKDQLPIVEYSVLSRPHGEEQEEDVEDFCDVCLYSIEACHKVRELGNCRHVFHVGCLDAWMDCDRGTCPVCRAELLPGHREESRPGEDPWRSERMIYLFGEDCVIE